MATQDQAHLTQPRYATAADALADAHRVLVELEHLAGDELLIPTAEMQFTARRARKLVEACQALEAHRNMAGYR